MADPGGPPVRDYVYASSRPAWKKDAYGLIDCEKACAGQPFPTRPCGAGCSRYYLCQLCNAAEASSTGELAAIAKIAQGAVEDGAIAVALGHTKDLPSELKLLGQFSQAALMRDLNGCLDYCSLCPNHDCPAPIPQGELGKK